MCCPLIGHHPIMLLGKCKKTLWQKRSLIPGIYKNSLVDIVFTFAMLILYWGFKTQLEKTLWSSAVGTPYSVML